MSSTSPLPTAPYLVQLTVASLPLPASNAAQASIVATITDTTGNVLAPVTLLGTETPPWSFQIQLTHSTTAGSASFQALDTSGAAIGLPLTGPFTIAPAATFNSPASFTVTAVTSSVSASAAHVAAARKA